MGRILPLVVVLALLCSCGSAPVERLDLIAQRAEQRAITAEWLAYVEADPELAPEQKAARRTTAAAQDLRIRKAEEAAGVTGGAR